MRIGTERVQMIGVLTWLIHWVLLVFCPALAALVDPEQKFFFLTVHYSIHVYPIAQQAGQAVVSGRLSLNVCLFWSQQHLTENKIKITYFSSFI